MLMRIDYIIYIMHRIQELTLLVTLITFSYEIFKVKLTCLT